MIKERNLDPALRAKIRQAGINLSPNANIIYVDSGNANAGAGRDGTDPTNPLSTIDAALTANTSGVAATNGDLIVVMPGHSETTTAAITMDVAGVTILGLGDGTAAPQITGNHTGDIITITAANCTVAGLYFNEATAAATSFINVAAANARVAYCTFDSGANDVDAITITAAGERPRFDHNTVVVTADGPDSWLKFEGVVDLPIIEDNIIVGSDGTNAYDDGVFDFNSQAVTNPLVRNNVFNGAGQTITVVANGSSVTNPVYGPNTYVSATSADTVSTQQEIVDALYGSAGIATFPSATAPANGVSLAESIRYLSENQLPRLVSKAVADVTAATAWTTANSPITLFTVTGDVLVRAWGVVTTNFASTSNTGTISLGTADAATALIPAATADGTALQAGDVWFDTTSGTNAGGLPDDGSWVAIGNGADIVVAIATNNMTAGGMTTYVQWMPVSSGSSVVAA